MARILRARALVLRPSLTPNPSVFHPLAVIFVGRLYGNCINRNMPGDFENAPDNPPENPDAHGTTDAIPDREIASVIDRISKSRTMSGSRRLIQLLTFVVSSTLKGDAEHLKETTIGVAVFGRKPDYDPKVDTIVRSQAWRLRAKLKKYYATEGAADHIIIEIPTGHYVPVFHVRDEALIG